MRVEKLKKADLNFDIKFQKDCPGVYFQKNERFPIQISGKLFFIFSYAYSYFIFFDFIFSHA